ncbi:hypothetical protein COT72_05105 [archaeon CG10_big_fil_rev_8_21_14_0_10_43_11]|nr:MAG: hypothetical protein COT72_05105 [archaeon CG10_big_fil_rev_8_21_14_0_10_43_11]
MFDIKTFSQPTIKNPVLIEGLPGIANVARISVDLLVEKLGAQKMYEIYSHHFPAFVMIEDDSTITLPKIDVYHVRAGERDLILVVGDVQAADEYNYALCEKIIELTQPKEIITIGGMALLEAKPRVHGVVTTPELKTKLEPYSLVFDGNDTVSLVVGAAGIFLGLAKNKNIPGFGLLVETDASPTHFGIKAAKGVLEILAKHLALDLDLSNIENDIALYEKEIGKRAKREDEIRDYMLQHSDTDNRYIG